MTADAAHESWWQTFEVVFGVPFLVAIGLQLIFPHNIHNGFLTPIMILGGISLIVAGIVLVILARRELAQFSQPTDPGSPTSRLVTTGIFSLSRNPLYLGGVCMLLGISLTFNLPWALLLLIPAIIASHYILIRPEEVYLSSNFGEEYENYAASVHRWLGRQGPND